jgi:hypothetical protein
MKQEWCPQHAGNLQNLSSMRYIYSIASPKLAGRTFATHTDLIGQRPKFIGSDDWYRLSDGGSRLSCLERHLATTDTAELVTETTNGVKCCTVRKGAIVLSEALPDGTWKISVPYSGDAINDDENTESIAQDVDARDLTHPGQL